MANTPKQGDIVVLRAFDDVPRHLFEVDDFDGETLTGVALTGPLRGAYGEPDAELIESIISL